MQKLLVLGSTLVFLAGSAVAQQHQNPPAANSPQNEAVKSPNTQQTSGPVAGANSFTEGQAKSRIQDKGYTSVSELKKDDNGVWRGKAMKDGKSVDVSLDYQGNVAAK
jgi:hypothetical protein